MAMALNFEPGTWNLKPETILHPTVINPTFLFPLCFIRRQRSVTGTFLYIYTMYKGQKTENLKGVCTRAASHVHTVGGVSSDTLLQVVLTPDRGCGTRVGKSVTANGGSV